MSNTITGLIPVIFRAYNTVAREMTGFINHVYRNSDATQAAVGQSVTYPIVPAATGGDITPGQQPPDDGDQTLGNGTLTISKSKYSPVRWNGEEQKAVAGQYNGILEQQFAQSFRWLVNQVETDLAAAALVGASRACGTAGTAPFGTAGDLSDFALSRQILDDNGSPQSDLHIVVNSSAMASLRGKQSVLFKVNEAGTDAFLRRGIIGQVQGFDIGNSAGLVQHVKGAGASYVTSGSTAVGVKDIALVTGTGTVLAGDVVTFAADAVNKYVVGTGVTAPGTISLNNPGARVVIATANALTVGNSFTPNIAFQRNAIHLVTRAPAMPEGGDIADDVFNFVDPVTGLVFQIALYRLYRRIKFEIGLAWGYKVVNGEFVSLLMG
jgi:hypothetical protein